LIKLSQASARLYIRIITIVIIIVDFEVLIKVKIVCGTAMMSCITGLLELMFWHIELVTR